MVTQRTVSARRVLASRVNGAKSNGPKTAEGKERASRNRLCHGFFSRHLLLPGEDAAELEALRQELMDDIQPRGCVEELLVERLVTAHWKLSRLHQAEHRMIQECTGGDRKPKPAAEMLSRMIYCGTESDRISIYQNRLEATIHRCMRELRVLRKEEKSAERRARSDEKETSLPLLVREASGAFPPLPPGEGRGEGRPDDERGSADEMLLQLNPDEVRKSASAQDLAQSPHPNPLPEGEGGAQHQKMRFEPNPGSDAIPADGGKDYNSDLCRTG